MLVDTGGFIGFHFTESFTFHNISYSSPFMDVLKTQSTPHLDISPLTQKATP